jgi:hypothetical protein
VTTTLFQWFICANVDPDNQDADEFDLYLVSDMSISCQTIYYRRWTVYVVLMMIIYPIGIPSLYLYLLRQHRDELINRNDADHFKHKEDTESLPAFVIAQQQGRVFEREDEESGGNHSRPSHSSRESESFSSNARRGSVMDREAERAEKYAHMSPTARRLAFLWQAYKPEYWYWEIIETTRKLMLTAVLSVCSPGSSEQSIFGVIMAWAYITLYSYYQPYEGASDNVLAAAGQIQIFFTFFAALIIQNDLMGKKWNLLLGINLTVVNTAIIFLSFYFEIVNYHMEMKERHEEEMKQREKMTQMRMAKRLEFANKAGEEIVAAPVIFQKKQVKELVQEDPGIRNRRFDDDDDDDDEGGTGMVVNKMHLSGTFKKPQGKASGQEVELTNFTATSSRSASTNSSANNSAKKFTGVQNDVDSDDED